MANGMKKLRCGSKQPHQAEKEIGPEGGSIGHGGHRLDVPPGALERASRFLFVVPASEYLEVEITMEPRQGFRTPAPLTLNYAHCPSLPKEERFIARLGGGGEPVERLASRDNGQKVTAALDRLSGYAVAT